MGNSNLLSISLMNRMTIKIDEFYLDAYSIHKYQTFYLESKTKVRADIKQLSEKYKVTDVRSIKILLFEAILTGSKSKSFKEKWEPIVEKNALK